MIIQYFSEPWQHIIIDDTFDRELFNKMTIEIETLVLSTITIKKNLSKLIWLSDREDNILHHTSLGVKSFNINDSRFLDFFTDKRISKKITKQAQLAIHSNIDVNIHDETYQKILSSITYMCPERSRGTLLYKTPKELVKEIEWRPNRTLLFCGKDFTTWHSFLAGNEKRVTLNQFLLGIDRKNHVT